LNIQSIVQFLILVGESGTTDEVAHHLESLLSTYGFPYYGLRIHQRPHHDTAVPALLGRWPEGWNTLYASRKYGLVDPTIRMLSTAQRPFRWKEAVIALRSDPQRPRMDRMMQEAGRVGLHDGYVFPIHGRNGLLGSMAVGGQPVDLSPAEIALFQTSARLGFWRILEIRGEAEALEEAAKVDTQLTRREMEVIMLLADGLTSHEIAKALAISNHTVDWYINGLQEKLKAKNRQHVVALAFRLGLVA
jgi:LuxR family transcriptional regulator